jgi:energy-coupling factor transport system ATP-binding protein
MDVVTVQNLSFVYPCGTTVLRDISFEIKAGEIFVIAGLSGCGKTTLCHILCGIIPNSIGGTLTGTVSVAGCNGNSFAETALHVGLVFQDSDAQLICATVEDELAFGLENLCVEPSEIRARVDKMLRRLGLYERRLLNPAALSGGQKKLVALGSVLILEPKILILDEPMSNLDEEGRSLVRSAIDELHAQGRTLVIVEHDLSLALFADKWMLLNNGEVAAIDTPQRLFANKAFLRELKMWYDYD